MKTNTKLLTSALSSLSSIAGKRTTLPVLNCVKIGAASGRLTLTASNLETFATVSIEAEDELETCCVPIKTLRAVIGNSDAVDMKLKDGQLTITQGTSKSRIPTMPAEEFPASPVVTGAALPVNLGELAKAIDKAGYAWTDEPGRPACACIALRSSKGVMDVCTTDGRQLALAEIAADCDIDVSIPAADIGPFRQAMDATGATIRIGDAWAEVAGGYGFVRVRLSESLFPKFRQLIPKDPAHRATVSRAAFIDALATCSGFVTAKCSLVKLTPGTDVLNVAIESDAGQASIDIPKTGGTGTGPIGIAPERMLAILRHLDEAEVKVCYDDDLSPIVMREGNVTAVLMPLRLLSSEDRIKAETQNA